jgi:hypothetical protein
MNLPEGECVRGDSLCYFGLTIVTAFCVLLILPKQPAEAAGVVGTGTPGSCTEAALNTALAGGAGSCVLCAVF